MKQKSDEYFEIQSDVRNVPGDMKCKGPERFRGQIELSSHGPFLLQAVAAAICAFRVWLLKKVQNHGQYTLLLHCLASPGSCSLAIALGLAVEIFLRQTIPFTPQTDFLLWPHF